MADITVTVNPREAYQVTLGQGVALHASTHASGGSDSLAEYYYPRYDNPSGYITSGNFATTGYVADVSGAIVAQISFPANVVFTTGDQNISGVKNFYSRPTVNGTGVLLSGEASAADTGYLTGYVSKTETGAYSTVFYPRNNPSGYITGVDLSNYATIPYVTGVSGYLQNQITVLNGQTGDYALTSNTGSFLTTGAGDLRYYPLSANPSSYLVAADIADLASAGYVTGVSGYLQGQILTLNLLSGQGFSGYNDSITGVDVAGTSTKTITLYQRDGGTLSANFVDLQGTGVGSDYYLTGAAFNTGSLFLYVNNGTIVSTVIDGRYALESNTGAFLTTGAGDNRYVLQSATGAYTGAFYPLNSNPSGYITGVDLSNYATTGYVTGVSGYLQNQISAIDNQTGNFALKSQTGTFLTTGAGDNRYVLQSSTGAYTGAFYPLTGNPSGFLVSADLSTYATQSYVTGASGHLQGQITALSSATGDYALKSQTGAFITTGAGDARYYPLTSNPSSYLVAADIAHLASTGYVTGVSGYLQGQISAINNGTGNFITSSQTGQFYPINNPSGYITGVDLSSYATIPFVTGISGYHSGLIAVLYAATGSYALSNNTGSFLTTGAGDARYYPLLSNPSSYLVAADLASYATTGYVTGVSGYLQNQISILNSFTGQASSGYNDSITGLSFSGTDTKTLYLYQRDGGIISGDFTDLQGTGGSVSNVVYLTGDQNISGVKNFVSRPTVGLTGVVLSGEYIPTVRELYIDAGAMLTGISGATPTVSSIGLLSYDSYLFDATTTGYAQFKVSISDYNQGSLKSKFHWTTSGSSGSVVWGIQCAAAGNGDPLPTVWGGQEVTDSFITGTGFHLTDSTSSITPSGSPQTGDSLFFRVYRNTFSESDTLAVGLNLLGVSIQYTGSSIQSW